MRVHYLLLRGFSQTESFPSGGIRFARAVLWLVAAVVVAGPAAAQTQQPFSDETVTQLVTSATRRPSSSTVTRLPEGDGARYAITTAPGAEVLALMPERARAQSPVS
jgi:hypothetical protein